METSEWAAPSEELSAMQTKVRLLFKLKVWNSSCKKKNINRLLSNISIRSFYVFFFPLPQPRTFSVCVPKTRARHSLTRCRSTTSSTSNSG